MGLGTWAWGDRILWNYGRGYSDEDIRAAFEVATQEGIRFIDTAEVYGQGKSERMVGKLIRESGQAILIATKFMPFPWRLSRKSLLRALRHSLERLGMERVDLYQIHWPFPPVPIETWMDALAEAVAAGLTRTVGVSNYNQTQMMRAYSALARHDIPLASNQVKYSLLDRKIEKNGLLARCKELGVRLIAYSPLEMGLLTGKYTPENPPPGLRGRRYAGILANIQPLLRLMTEIGQDLGGKSPAQIALNWVICKGALPIPGAKNARQAAQNAGALGWRLSEDQVAALDEMSDRVTQPS
ncbi:MAG: aldo/keto reductase [Anaerolineae bacterium]|nr:MAG: aldo/keto reductase [Anaerolineae bacterium]